MHHGFVPQGEVNMVRRGPAAVKLEEAVEKEGSGVEKVEVEVVAREAEEALAS
jgi:hypothetical protein